MPTTIPQTTAAFSALLRADFTAQWRNRRSFILVLLVPVIILVSWKGLVDKLGGAIVLSTSITIGLVAIGLMGYSNSIARDRDKGIFQRLRVAPVPAWLIMASRLSVQLIMIVLVNISVFIAGYYFDHILISAPGYTLTFITAIIGGALYLGLGQVIVGLIKNPETVNSTSRLVYFIFIMVGMYGESGALGKQLEQVVKWSPYGVVKKIVSAGMEPSAWNGQASEALLVTVLYATLFAIIGIRKFQWNTR